MFDQLAHHLEDLLPTRQQWRNDHHRHRPRRATASQGSEATALQYRDQGPRRRASATAEPVPSIRSRVRRPVLDHDITFDTTTLSDQRCNLPEIQRRSRPRPLQPRARSRSRARKRYALADDQDKFPDRQALIHGGLQRRDIINVRATPRQGGGGGFRNEAQTLILPAAPRGPADVSRQARRTLSSGGSSLLRATPALGVRVATPAPWRYQWMVTTTPAAIVGKAMADLGEQGGSDRASDHQPQVYRTMICWSRYVPWSST